jgi:hypothetical protein
VDEQRARCADEKPWPKDVQATSQSAIDVAQSELDLELLYRGNVEVDTFHLYAQQLRVHATASDLAGLSAEVAALEWIRNRLGGRASDSRLARRTLSSAHSETPPRQELASRCGSCGSGGG